MVNWEKFASINLICALTAAAFWYVFPQLMAWPLLIGVIPWLLRLAHEGKWQWRTPFDLPLLLFLITGLISVWTAFDNEIAWEKFWTIAAGVLLFYAFAAFSLPGAPGKPERGGIPTAWFLAIFGAGVSIYFIATNDWSAFPSKYEALTTLGRTIQSPIPHLPGHRLHPNVVGGILAMMIPFAAAVSLEAREARNTPALVLGLGLLVVTLLGLLLSVSRGAWIATCAASGLAALWWLVGFLDSNQDGKRRFVFIVTLLACLAAVTVVALLIPSALQKLINNLPVASGGQDRLQLFQNSLILVQEYPFIGAGLGSFMMLYSTYSYLTHVGFIIHAHNIYLDVWIEQGVIALIALIWAWIIFGAAVWRESYRGYVRAYFGAAILSLVTIMLHGLVEDALYGSRSLMLMFLPLAFALPYPEKAKEAADKHRWLFQGAILGLIVIVTLMWFRPLQSSLFTNIASLQQSNLELGEYSWPEWPIQDAVRQETDLSRPINGFENALLINPLNAAANRRLGQIELSLGEYEDALKHLKTAYSRTPWDHATKLLYGEALLTNGFIEEGTALWSDINNTQGQLQARSYWYQHIEDEERLENIETGAGG